MSRTDRALSYKLGFLAAVNDVRRGASARIYDDAENFPELYSTPYARGYRDALCEYAGRGGK
jgi:hypothetical protein